MTSKELMDKLESLASHDPKDLAGMARFGINVDKAWAISIPKLRALAKEIKKDVISTGMEKSSIKSGGRSLDIARDDMWKVEIHNLALEIWDSGVHEAKILAGLMDVPELVTEQQMEKWVLGFDSWDVVDMVVGNLFDRTDFSIKKAHEWSLRPEQYVKRAGFVIMATIAVHNKALPDLVFLEFLEIIKRESGDDRNYVKKAINWALRSIGKTRNKNLYNEALNTAANIMSLAGEDKSDGGKASRWVANGAISELRKEYIVNRFL